MKEHVSQVYLNEHALLLFSCTVWRQTDRAHAKHAALVLRWPKAVALALSIYAVFRGLFLPIGSTLTLFFIIFLNSCCDI